MPSPESSSMTSLRTGEKLDHYIIEDLVARSSMASIYRATDELTGKPVAIKIPHHEMETDPVFFERFHREQEIGEKLDHPGVMKVYPSSHHSQAYMVVEWVDGRSLRQIMNAQQNYSPERAVKISLHIAAA